MIVTIIDDDGTETILPVEPMLPIKQGINKEVDFFTIIVPDKDNELFDTYADLEDSLIRVYETLTSDKLLVMSGYLGKPKRLKGYLKIYCVGLKAILDYKSMRQLFQQDRKINTASSSATSILTEPWSYTVQKGMCVKVLSTESTNTTFNQPANTAITYASVDSKRRKNMQIGYNSTSLFHEQLFQGPIPLPVDGNVTDIYFVFRGRRSNLWGGIGTKPIYSVNLALENKEKSDALVGIGDTINSRTLWTYPATTKISEKTFSHKRYSDVIFRWNPTDTATMLANINGLLSGGDWDPRDNRLTWAIKIPSKTGTSGVGDFIRGSCAIVITYEDPAYLSEQVFVVNTASQTSTDLTLGLNANEVTNGSLGIRSGQNATIAQPFDYVLEHELGPQLADMDLNTEEMDFAPFQIDGTETVAELLKRAIASASAYMGTDHGLLTRSDFGADVPNTIISVNTPVGWNTPTKHLYPLGWGKRRPIVLKAEVPSPFATPATDPVFTLSMGASTSSTDAHDLYFTSLSMWVRTVESGSISKGFFIKVWHNESGVMKYNNIHFRAHAHQIKVDDGYTTVTYDAPLLESSWYYFKINYDGIFINEQPIGPMLNIPSDKYFYRTAGYVPTITFNKAVVATTVEVTLSEVLYETLNIEDNLPIVYEPVDHTPANFYEESLKWFVSYSGKYGGTGSDAPKATLNVLNNPLNSYIIDENDLINGFADIEDHRSNGAIVTVTGSSGAIGEHYIPSKFPRVVPIAAPQFTSSIDCRNYAKQIADDIVNRDVSVEFKVEPENIMKYNVGDSVLFRLEGITLQSPLIILEKTILLREGNYHEITLKAGLAHSKKSSDTMAAKLNTYQNRIRQLETANAQLRAPRNQGTMKPLGEDYTYHKGNQYFNGEDIQFRQPTARFWRETDTTNSGSYKVVWETKNWNYKIDWNSSKNEINIDADGIYLIIFYTKNAGNTVGTDISIYEKASGVTNLIGGNTKGTQGFPGGWGDQKSCMAITHLKKGDSVWFTTYNASSKKIYRYIATIQRLSNVETAE